MKSSSIALGMLALSTTHVNAFPRFQSEVLQSLAGHSKGGAECPYSAAKKPEKRQVGFDASTQYVSTAGDHAFVPPNFEAGDQRGPCPGLNALANHFYLPHSGVADIPTIVNAVNTGKLTELRSSPLIHPAPDLF